MSLGASAGTAAGNQTEEVPALNGGGEKGTHSGLRR